MAALNTRLAAALIATAVGLLALFALSPTPVHGQEIICSSFGGGPPYNFQTYEATRDRVPYLTAQRLAAQDKLLPNDATFSLPDILVGPPNSRVANATAAIPPQLLHAISWIESRLNQAGIAVPYETTGAVLISSSCAYGLMQVASFFTNGGDIPSRAESLAGTHYAYNIAAGAGILTDKWNLEFFPVVGAGAPDRMESWYYATWAYNGWSTVNHPAGPDVDPFRSLPYRCDGPFNGYAYQELVFGCAVTPPVVDGVRLWSPLPIQLPNLGALAAPGGPLDPEIFFDGWALVTRAPFTGEDATRPFEGMHMPLPSGAAPVVTQLINAATAAAQRGLIFGPPTLVVDAGTLELEFTENTVQSATFTIRNTGRGLLVFRIVPQQDWITVSASAGIAIGSDFPVGAGGSRTATVRLDPFVDGLAEGLHQGSIMVEALLPDGSVITATIVVILGREGVPSYEAGTPQS